jgi:hypothetical protein
MTASSAEVPLPPPVSGISGCERADDAQSERGLWKRPVARACSTAGEGLSYLAQLGGDPDSPAGGVRRSVASAGRK